MRLCMKLTAMVMFVAAMVAVRPVVASQTGESGAVVGPNMIEGTVSGVDWGAGRLSIGGVAGFLSTEIMVTPETIIRSSGNEPIALKDVRKGDVIRARYRKAGDENVATSIVVVYGQGQPPADPREPKG
ncbi:MAG: hypothetical protein V2A77_05425 [Pseudomonadota bacterium]